MKTNPNEIRAFVTEKTWAGEKRIAIRLGKVNAFRHPRAGKRNMVDVEISMKTNKNGRPCLSVCGDVWNHCNTDILEGGQCQDSLAKLKSQLPNPNRKILSKILSVWNEWHLNDVHPGTEEQENCLNEHADERKGIVEDLNRGEEIRLGKNLCEQL